MGYAYYEFSNSDPLKAGMPRGYSVTCKCGFRGCRERIDRGLAYLCYSCTGYFCEKHLGAAFNSDDELIEFDCVLGHSSQCCTKCASEAETVTNQ